MRDASGLIDLAAAKDLEPYWLVEEEPLVALQSVLRFDDSIDSRIRH